MNITQDLIDMGEMEYADFEAKLAPGVSRDSCLGVRVPNIRKYEKTIEKTEECREFITCLPHKYYDENMLHSIFLSRLKDYDECIEELERFLPYVDNWAVCDTLRPGVLKKRVGETLEHIKRWIESGETYTCRFGIDMLMTYFLDENFNDEYLEFPASLVSDEYYVNMMTAWFFATALAKQWDATIPYLTGNRLPVWVHNKTIQKAVESYRITVQQKEYLKSLRRKGEKQ